MCFHISLTKEENEITQVFDAVYNSPLLFESYYHFNGWETKNLSIIKQDDETLIDLATWGILPTHYNLSKRTNFLAKNNTLNATKERLFDSNLFSKFIKFKKCIIIADGFFEPYTAAGTNEKIPYYFKEKNNKLFAFAGIYSVIEDKVTKPRYSASLITTEANSFFKEIHNKPNKLGSYRMPLILDPNDYWEWLHTSDEDSIKTLLHTFTKQELIAYPVSKDLFKTSVDTNTASILHKVEFQKGLF
ncbi:MAG: SOS response-associated peptidase [Polaribacter sp.]|uniref:SOS response-associated peptidase n=1 Tax=Polaribacter sp. TaxID=1920175 RepID=UPI003BAF9B03